MVLLIIFPVALALYKHWIAHRRHKNERHIAAHPELQGLPVLEKDAEWPADGAIKIESPIEPDGRLDEAAPRRGWGVFRGV